MVLIDPVNSGPGKIVKHLVANGCDPAPCDGIPSRHQELEHRNRPSLRTGVRRFGSAARVDCHVDLGDRGDRLADNRGAVRTGPHPHVPPDYIRRLGPRTVTVTSTVFAPCQSFTARARRISALSGPKRFS